MHISCGIILALSTAVFAVPNFPSPHACPTLPSPLPSASALPIIPDLPNPWQFFDGSPVKSTEDWACRKAELKILVQEYLYGYYPDHSKEVVTSTRVGDTVFVKVTAGGKSGTFNATLTFPNNTSRGHPVPVMIDTGGVDTNVFLGSGVALATFNPSDVAADSTTPGGAFWDIYSGRDIGLSAFSGRINCP